MCVTLCSEENFFWCRSVAKLCPLFATPWNAACQPSLSFTVFWSLLKFMSIDQWYYLNISSSATLFSSALSLSQHQGFSNESALHIRWPKYWSFNISISPSSEYSGLISFQIDWFDLLAVEGTLKILFQHFSAFKKSIPFSSVQSLSRLTLCDPMNHSTPGLPVHHQLPEFTQTHVHRVSDAIQPSHPLSSASHPSTL